MRRLLLAVTLVTFAGCGGGSTTLTPPPVIFTEHKAAGNFYVDYTGPKLAALDAIDAGGRFFSASGAFVLDARMAGPVFTSETNFYVWGIQRGSGTASPFPDEPNVKFDAVAVVTANPGGTLTAVVNVLDGSPAKTVNAKLTAPDTIELIIPVTLLPATTATTPAGYQWNLWPRNGVGGKASTQIASFIPENALAAFVTVNQ